MNLEWSDESQSGYSYQVVAFEYSYNKYIVKEPW